MTARDGYAFQLSTEEWESAPDDNWDTVMVVPSEVPSLAFVGVRWIDGARCAVFRSSDGSHVAQVRA